jgi:DNA polymerase III psi subunit
MRIGKLTIDRKVLILIWDLFMVWMAVVNLSLILFDMTYLWIRPYYFHYIPVVTRIYDPVLGIEPHPLTEELSVEATGAEDLLLLDSESPGLEHRLDNLATLTTRVLSENVFDRSGQRRSRIIITRVIADEAGAPTADLMQPEVLETIVRDFWSGDPDLLRHRFALFDSEIRPLLQENFYREFNRAGRLTDHFWIIDLPFLILFWVEFTVRWILALRRKTHAQWFFFPIFNWYDVLGLIPMQVFRPFRLLRAVSMYMRLRRSELSSVGKDFATRTVEYISNIITEEVSDRVSVRILDDYAEESGDGTHLRIIKSTIAPRRDDIEEALAEHVRLLLTNDDTLQSFGNLLRLNLERAVESSESLHSVPLPNAVLKPVVRVVGEIILDTTLETIQATLDTEEGAESLRELSSSIVDSILRSPVLGETTTLVEEITLNVIEHMKETVLVKKWALSDEERTERKALADKAIATNLLEDEEDDG